LRRLRGAIAQLDTPQPNEQALRCDVSPIKPSLNFSFRYQAGYTVAVPMNQYLGSGHGWSMLTRITPEGGDAKPEFGTVIKVLHALGIDLIAQPKAEEAA
jgi:hypothetical protein